MKFYIKHETRGRLRIHLAQKRMSYNQADTLLYYLENLDGVASAKVYERTCDAVVNYQGSRDAVIRGIREFHYQELRESTECRISGEADLQGHLSLWKKTFPAISAECNLYNSYFPEIYLEGNRYTSSL